MREANGDLWEAEVLMAYVRWTGHPFVDAGLAALLAGTDIERLEDLTPDSLQRAVDALSRLLLSDQALGIGVERSFAKGALSQIFPNGELANPSNWKGGVEAVRTKFARALDADLARAMRCLEKSGTQICMICGQPRPDNAFVLVRKDKVPLLEGIVNFYPGLRYGLLACGLCALAVRFLPMSILRTGGSKRLWFFHTYSLSLALDIAREHGWNHFDRAIAANQPLDFRASWQTAGEAATALYILCELLRQHADHLRSAYEHPLPTTAYLFSNDNRGGYVEAIPIPNELLRFLALLFQDSPSAYDRFWRELLVVPADLADSERRARARFVQAVASRLVEAGPIAGLCLDAEMPRLRGGWAGHRRYLQEVRRMSLTKLAVIERLGLAIAQSPDARKYITELRTSGRGQLYPVLLRLVRDGFLSHEEFYLLVPPNDSGSAAEVRDLILAVTYEWEYCQQRNEHFPRISLELQNILPVDETLQRIQDIGNRLVSGLPNLGRWVAQLQTARSSDRIRACYLAGVQRGALRFEDFLFLAPFQDQRRLWLLRDYVLAFLFDRARSELAEEAETLLIAEPVEEQQVEDEPLAANW